MAYGMQDLTDRGATGADALALVNFPTEAALLTDIEARLKAGQGFAIATLNLDHVVKMRRNPDFRRAYLAHSQTIGLPSATT